MLSSTVTATRSGWAESVFWWGSSWRLQRKLSFLPFSTSQHFVLLQERKASRATPKVVLCQHKLYYLDFNDRYRVLCIIGYPEYLPWEKKEVNPIWWSTVGPVRCGAISVDGGCSVLQGVRLRQEGQVPALLDHHHLHLHLHLLHHHLHYQQCCVHTVRCQCLQIVDIFTSFNVWLI